MKTVLRLTSLTAVGLVMGALVTNGTAHADQVNLYSYRQPALIQPLLDAFTGTTGIKVNVVYADKGILERLRVEGRNSPADAVLTVDVGNLNDLVEADLLQPVRSEELEANIPPQFRHPDGLWYGLSMRARVIFASRDRVGENEIKGYEDLADPRFKGRICSRSGKHVYNVSLIASVIAHDGEEKAEAWLRGIKDNLAQRPQGNDRSQVKAIYEGVCDVALGNTYYMGLLETDADNPQAQVWANAVRIIFPNQGDRGTHVNVSGMAVTKSARHRAEAVRLMEFLAGEQAQRMYADRNFEFPVKPGIALNPVVAAWGPFTPDAIGLAEVASYRAAASRLVDRVGFDDAGGS